MAKASYEKPSGTAYLNQLFVFAVDNARDAIEDQIFRTRPALAFLLERRDNTMLTDTEQIEIPLEIGENPNGGWIGESEALGMDDYDPVEAAYYSPKSMGYSLKWTKQQQRAIKAKAKRLVNFKIENTRKTITKNLSLGLWTGSGGTSKEMDGLPRLIPATLPASQTVDVGRLSPSTRPWWRTQAINMTGLPAVSHLESNMLTMYNNITAEGGNPSIIFSDQTTHETYEKNALDYMTIGPAKIADVTFELCQFKKVPMTFDKDAPSGQLRMVSGEDIKFCVVSDYWFAWTDWKEAVDLPFTKFKQVLCDCNLVRTQARTHGCIFNIS